MQLRRSRANQLKKRLGSSVSFPRHGRGKQPLVTHQEPRRLTPLVLRRQCDEQVMCRRQLAQGLRMAMLASERAWRRLLLDASQMRSMDTEWERMSALVVLPPREQRPGKPAQVRGLGLHDRLEPPVHQEA